MAKKGKDGFLKTTPRKESTGRKPIDPTGEPLVPLNVTVFVSLKEWIDSHPNKSEKVREALALVKAMEEKNG